jgi:hypothetical protein
MLVVVQDGLVLAGILLKRFTGLSGSCYDAAGRSLGTLWRAIWRTVRAGDF